MGNQLHTTPPMQAGSLAGRDTGPVWPLVIGIVAVVWGAVCLLSAVFGLLVLKLVRITSKPDGPDATIMAMMQGSAWYTFSTFSGLAAAGLLVIVGIGMIRRRRWSVPGMKVWAWYTIVMTLVGIGIAVFMLDEMVAASTAQGQPGPISPSMMKAMMIGGFVFGFVFSAAPPAALLYWLHRPAAREHISEWK